MIQQLCLGIWLFSSVAASARVDVATTVPIPLPREEFPKKITGSDWKQYLPEGVEFERDMPTAGRRIADQSLQALWKQSEMSRSPAARRVEKTEEKLRTEVEVRGEREVDHKVTFQVRAFQAQALMRYEGWTNAELKYDSLIGQTGLEFIEPIGPTQSVYWGHSSSPMESRSVVGIRFPW